MSSTNLITSAVQFPQLDMKKVETVDSRSHTPLIPSSRRNLIKDEQKAEYENRFNFNNKSFEMRMEHPEGQHNDMDLKSVNIVGQNNLVANDDGNFKNPLSLKSHQANPHKGSISLVDPKAKTRFVIVSTDGNANPSETNQNA